MAFSLNNFHTYIHEKVNKIELEIKIRKILLPINYRTVLIFYYWQELTYHEIAEAMKIPVGTVKTYLLLKRKS